MEQNEMNAIAEAVTSALTPVIDKMTSVLEGRKGESKKEDPPPGDGLSKGVRSFVNNQPENAVDLKDCSAGVRTWVENQAKGNPGKELSPKADQGPTRINGTLTGKTI